MIPFYEYIVNESDETGFYMNSVVDRPAHQKPFLTFSKEVQKYAFNDEEMTVMGVLISANTPIYRTDAELGEYYGLFSKKTITTIKRKLMQQMRMHGVNKQHNDKSIVHGAYMTDIFQVDFAKGIQVPDSLKAQNIQDGSLIAIYKIDDQNTWQEIKSGRFQGFSIEAVLDLKQVKIKTANNMSKTNKLFQMLFGKEQKFAEITTVDGIVLMYDGELMEGTPVFVQDAEGNQIPAPEGDYQVEVEGVAMVVTVDVNGVISAVTEVAAQSEEEEMSQEESILAQVAEVLKKTLTAQNDRFEALEKRNEELKAELEEVKNAKPSKFQSEPKRVTPATSYKDLIKK